MKAQYPVVLALLGGIAIGAAAVQGIHAQTKLPVYLVTEIDVNNPEAYGKEYAPKVQASIKAAGGRKIALGGGGGGRARNITAIEGAAPERASILVWDSVEKLQAWRNSEDFKEARKIGNKYATFRSFAIDGIE